MDEAPARTCLYGSAQLRVVVDDMARQAAGLLLGREKLAVVGILRRGVPLRLDLAGRTVASVGAL